MRPATLRIYVDYIRSICPDAYIYLEVCLEPSTLDPKQSHSVARAHTLCCACKLCGSRNQVANGMGCCIRRVLEASSCPIPYTSRDASTPLRSFREIPDSTSLSRVGPTRQTSSTVSPSSTPSTGQFSYSLCQSIDIQLKTLCDHHLSMKPFVLSLCEIKCLLNGLEFGFGVFGFCHSAKSSDCQTVALVRLFFSSRRHHPLREIPPVPLEDDNVHFVRNHDTIQNTEFARSHSLCTSDPKLASAWVQLREKSMTINPTTIPVLTELLGRVSPDVCWHRTFPSCPGCP